LPSEMAHFLSYHEKLPLLQSRDGLYWSLISASWCSIRHCVWLITLRCWQIWQCFTIKLNPKLVMSAARHPQIDGLIERVDETVQITLRCYSSRSAFLLGTSFTHGCFCYYMFSTNETSTHLNCLMHIY
jgi:hypothetical protein